MICETRTAPIDLMITDVVMPHFSGRQLAKPGIAPANHEGLFMSGYTDDAIVHHGVLDRECHSSRNRFRPRHLLERCRGT